MIIRGSYLVNNPGDTGDAGDLTDLIEHSGLMIMCCSDLTIINDADTDTEDR